MEPMLIVPETQYTGKAIKGRNNFEPSMATVKASGAHAVYISNASIVGGGYIYDEQTREYLYSTKAGPLFPGWVQSFTEKGMAYVFGRVEKTLELLSRARYLEPIYVPNCYTCLHYNFIYGHFLLEIVPKLFLIREMYRQGHVYPIALPGALPSWVVPHIHALFPEAVFEFFDDSRQKIVAGRLIAFAGDLFVLHPWMVQKYQEFPPGHSRSRRLFVVRPNNHRTTRIFSNQREIAEAASSQGFEIIEPSTLPLAAQAALFAEAAIVVGEFNSAMHNTVFSRPGMANVTINRVNPYQWRIANACGHYLDYVTPEGGNVEWGPEPIQFEISRAAFFDAIEAADEFMSSATASGK